MDELDGDRAAWGDWGEAWEGAGTAKDGVVGAFSTEAFSLSIFSLVWVQSLENVCPRLSVVALVAPCCSCVTVRSVCGAMCRCTGCE